MTQYESDFYSWAMHQAELLRSGRVAEADLINIAEEMETLGRREASDLRSSYRLISHHLLKMIFQRSKATTSWENTIVRERLNIESNIEDNPGLKPRRDELFRQGYALGRREAIGQTKLPEKTFPEVPPFGREQVESESFWPPGFPLRAPPEKKVVKSHGRGD